MNDGATSLKRRFGLDRCTWKGLESFKTHTWASVVSHNLLVLARHALPQDMTEPSSMGHGPVVLSGLVAMVGLPNDVASP